MISIGDYNIVNVLVQLEQRVATLEKTIQAINNKNGNLPGFKGISQEEFEAFKKESAKELIVKYPSLGLKVDGE
jgi:hypothetical protein